MERGAYPTRLLIGKTFHEHFENGICLSWDVSLAMGEGAGHHRSIAEAVESIRDRSRVELAQAAFEALKPGVSGSAKNPVGLDSGKDYTAESICLDCHSSGDGRISPRGQGAEGQSLS